MPFPRRSLTVEPFEDRFLPSVTYVVVPSDFALPARMADGIGPGAHLGPDFARWGAGFFAPDRIAMGFRGGFALRPNGPPPDGADPDGPPASDGPGTGGAARGPARGVARPHPDSPAGAESVALLPSESNSAPSDSRPGAPATERIPVTVPAVPSLVAQPLTVRVGVAVAAITTGVGNASGTAEPPAPSPPPADETPPAPTETTPAADLATETHAVAALVGLGPGDLAGLASAAGNFLGRLAALEVAWPDDMAEFEDYLWVAAATLLAAGAVHVSRSSRPGAQPRANGRPDSVLAAWEGTDAG
jgi:hypothetical protein